MKIIEVTYVSAGVTQILRVPENQIFAYWPDPADPTKTLVRHAASYTQYYQSTYDGTADELTAILTS